MSRNTLARIDAEALRHNLRRARELAPGSQVVSVIKADGYGHGLRRVAQALAETDLFAVATPGEADALRGAAWAGRLLMLEGFANVEGFEHARSLGAELVVHQPQQLEVLEQRGLGDSQRLWLKVNTGMNRLGFPAADAPAVLERLVSRFGRDRVIVMSHFACADEPGHDLNARQLETFDALPGFDEQDQSLANSAALLGMPESHRHYVRPGLMLFGIAPFAGREGTEFGLRPAMTLESELIAVNDCHAGDTVGYGAAWTAPTDTRIGIVAIGYGDGYPRHAKNGTPAWINGRIARLAGRVSMDMIALDLGAGATDAIGDRVVLWGAELPIEQVAPHADAVPYQLICGLTGRVRRVAA